jgi:hypothetical protein
MLILMLGLHQYSRVPIKFLLANNIRLLDKSAKKNANLKIIEIIRIKMQVATRICTPPINPGICGCSRST